MHFLLSLILLLSLAGPAGAMGKASYQHYLKAMLLANQGSFAEALREYEAALELDPESAFMYEQAAELALEVGRTDRALELAQRFSELAPQDPSARFLLGNVHWARGEFDAAREAFEETLRLKPDYEEALFTLGNLLSSQSPERAKAYLEEYLAKNPDNTSDAEYQIAVIEQRAGRLDDAVKHFTASVEADPDNMQARYSLAQVYEVKRDTDAALAVYLEILDRDGRNAPLLNHVGEMYYMKDDAEKARAHFERAKAAAPNNPATCLWLALLAEHEGKFGEAVQFVKESSALEADAGLNLRLSYYLTQDNRLKEAVEVLEAANQKWPGNEELAYFLALGYDDLKEHDKAVKLMLEVLKIRPEHRDARFQLGAIYEKKGDIQNAEIQFREILERHPNDASALNFLGYSLADRGLKLDEAEELIKKAVELNGKNGAYVDSLGWVYFKQGKLAEAVKTLEEAAGLLPEDEAIWSHLAEARQKGGDLDGAWEGYKRAQLLAPAKKDMADKLAQLERTLSVEQLGARYQNFISKMRGVWTSYGGPCIIEGHAGRGEFKFSGMLHFKAPGELTIDVMGPLFIPMFSVSVNGDAFAMNAPKIEGASEDELREHLHAALKLMRSYFAGAVFRDGPARYKAGWGTASLTVPGGVLSLDKDKTRVESLATDDSKELRLDLADYRMVGGRWVPASLTVKRRGFSMEFKIDSLSVAFE